LFDKYQKTIRVFDLKWLSMNANHSQATINAYNTFVESYLHEFNRPGKSFVVGNLIQDPRLFVFLRQQWEEYKNQLNLDAVLADSLILFALEGTDPDLEVFKTREEIMEQIAIHIRFDPKLLNDLIDVRLKVLSGRPRQIQYHAKVDGYCLPFSTRLSIRDKNLKDAALHADFKESVREKLEINLSGMGVSVRNPADLIDSTINKVFYQQGLEFADFILHGQAETAIEKDLPEIISAVVDESTVIGKNKEAVKTALLITIRELVYNGSTSQKLFLKKLSNTYMMLFLLQADPKVATYFTSLASKLKVYVCTSILVPALSEFYLKPFNRRHWNLLKGCRSAGVTLIVNDTIIRELVAHFRRIINVYDEDYKDSEEIYLGDEMQTLYISEIMIRAYFYAKREGHVDDFDSFIDNFVNPNLVNADANLISWLQHEFGIQYVSDASLRVMIDEEEVRKLTDVLRVEKKNQQKAESDSKLILAIFNLRAMNNEIGSDSIFGYRTWWLSKDTLTQRTVNRIFGDKYKIGCYIRPDFLYNYISLAPTKGDVDAAYSEIFPNLLGVNLGSSLPKEVTDAIHSRIKEHSKKNPARLKAILRDMAEKLKTDPLTRTRQYVEHFLDSELHKQTAGLLPS
jgi:hypothetical protein